MANVTSSTIGVDLNNPSSTALFALGTKVFGSTDSEWEYCIATGTLATGALVQISPLGTAIACTTAILNTNNPNVGDLGLAQFTIPQGQYAWIPTRGKSLYVACTGTITPVVQIGLSPTAGTIITGGAVALGQTMAGIQLEVSASTATASITTCTLQWPRFVTAGTSVVG